MAPKAPGYRLFWVQERAVGWMDLPVSGACAVLGRHTECDAILHGDPSVSLRHLLAMTVALADGPALRLMDLQTAVPFCLEDGIPRRSIIVSGPVAISVHRHVIGAIPIEEGDTPGALRLATADLRAPLVSDAAAAPRSFLHERQARSPAAHRSTLEANDNEHTHVTSIPASVPIATLSRSGSAVEATGARAGCATLMLHRKGRAASVELTEAELDVGVMVGRAERCIDAGLHEVLDNHISRGHVLLLHHGGAFEAFDLCSTHGTFAGGERVRRIVLSDVTTLSLASSNPVTLVWRRHPAALG